MNMNGTRQVTPREIRGVLDQVLERLSSEERGPEHLVTLKRHLAGRDSSLRRKFTVLIGKPEYEPGGLIQGLSEGLATKWAMADDAHAANMLRHIRVLPKTVLVKVQALSVREMGLDIDGASPVSYADVRTRVRELGFKKNVPPEVPAAMLKCAHDPHAQDLFHDIIQGYGLMYFLMIPLLEADGKPRIFKLGHGYLPNRFRSQYFLWSVPVYAEETRFNGDDFFVVPEEILEVGSEEWYQNQLKARAAVR